MAAARPAVGALANSPSPCLTPSLALPTPAPFLAQHHPHPCPASHSSSPTSHHLTTPHPFQHTLPRSAATMPIASYDIVIISRPCFCHISIMSLAYLYHISMIFVSYIDHVSIISQSHLYLTGLHSAAAPFGGAAATQNPQGAKLLSEVDTHEAS